MFRLAFYPGMLKAQPDSTDVIVTVTGFKSKTITNATLRSVSETVNNLYPAMHIASGDVACVAD